MEEKQKVLCSTERIMYSFISLCQHVVQNMIHLIISIRKLLYDVKNPISERLLSAEVDNILLNLHNLSHHSINNVRLT